MSFSFRSRTYPSAFCVQHTINNTIFNPVKTFPQFTLILKPKPLGQSPCPLVFLGYGDGQADTSQLDENILKYHLERMTAYPSWGICGYRQMDIPGSLSEIIKNHPGDQPVFLGDSQGTARLEIRWQESGQPLGYPGANQIIPVGKKLHQNLVPTS
jgi:hypothetical protein